MGLWSAVAALALVSACGFSAGGGSAASDARGDDDDAPNDSRPPDPDAPAGAWLAGFQYRRAITVTPGGTETLTDFPVGLIVNDAAIAQHARTDGASFVVTTNDAVTRLDSEVAGFNANGLELWVRVPSLPPTATTLYLYYDSAMTASTNPTGVWSSLFMGVWHLSDIGDGAHDSTIHAHDLVSAGGMNNPTHLAGKAGGARDFDGTGDLLSIADPLDGTLDVDARSFSYSIWVNEDAAHMEFDCPFHKGGPSQTQPGYTLLLGQNGWSAKVHDGTSQNSYDDVTFGAEATFVGAWTYLVAQGDRTAGKFRTFTNGALATEEGFALGSLATAQPLKIGTNDFQGFDGKIDEVRIYNAALTPGWIAAEHANLATSGFVQLGPETVQ